MRGEVLIVEDDPDVREILSFVVGSMGLTVTSANNGELGLEAINRQRPDLILLDLMMPKMGGFEMLNRLTQHSGSPIPIIIVSSLPAQDTGVMHLPGVVGALQKPNLSVIKVRELVTETLAKYPSDS